MKLGEALLCCDCDEIVQDRRTHDNVACPSCTSAALVPLKRFILPLDDKAEKTK